MILAHACYFPGAPLMLLAIDCATSTASLALYDPKRDLVLAEQTWQARRRHTQDVLVVAQSLFDLAAVAPDEVDTLAVTTGPGSFSGVRVGISIVHGIALGLPQPPRVLGFPTLSVTAAPWLEVAWASSPVAVVCAVLQAGRGRVNWCFFGPEDLLFRPTAPDHGQGTSAELVAALADHGAPVLWLVGEVDPALAAAVQPLPHVTVVSATSALRRAAHLARIAALLLAEVPEAGSEPLQPIYLRTP